MNDKSDELPFFEKILVLVGWFLIGCLLTMEQIALVLIIIPLVIEYAVSRNRLEFDRSFDKK